MKRRNWIWWGFAALLAVGILSGYVPDAMRWDELRRARAEGLLDLPHHPKVAKEDDAGPLYRAAIAKYPDAPAILASAFPSQIKTPAPHVVKYLEALVAASERPYLLGALDEWGNRDQYQLSMVFLGAKALIARARDESGLVPVARIARQIGSEGSLWGHGTRAVLVHSTLDRAAKLDLSPAARRRVSDAFGPSLSPRETLRRHVAQSVEAFARDERESGARVSRTRAEAGYLRFWSDFLRRSPREGEGFVEAVKAENDRIERAEDLSGEYTNLSSVVGYVSAPWGALVDKLETANRRLEAAR